MAYEANPIVSAIYGTGVGGASEGEMKAKIASAGIRNLKDLARHVAAGASQDGDKVKIAQATDAIHEQFMDADLAGRARAHQQFAMITAQALEGDTRPMADFLGLKVKTAARKRKRKPMRRC